jgi:phosphoribosyl 1,2-cyclic phosphodiesterase
MKVKFYGVRGSIASPGQNTVKYGGNTTCIMIETDSGEILILDAGTGIHILAQELIKKLPLKCSIFITHTHWDHIQGLPFFIPLFIAKNEIVIYGASDPVSGGSIKDILSRQMEYRYFPVREAELKADITYIPLNEKQTIETGSAKITSILMNHPVINYGYKIECGGKSVFFTGDNEPLYNIYKPQDDYYEIYEDLIAEKNVMLMNFINGVDLIIADSAYTAEEYPLKRGWGHGTFDSCVTMAKEAHAKKLCLTHHEPLRSDDDLDNIFSKLQMQYSSDLNMPEIIMAKEGLELFI